MKRMAVVGFMVVVAVGSFAYGRHRYVDDNRATVGGITATNPFVDTSLFGSWVKDQWFFTILIPVIALGGGLVWTLKK